MAQQSKAQKDTLGRVMHEFKHGELKTARGSRKVKKPRQAIAIALHEAGASRYESKEENKRNLRHTKRKEALGETYKDEAEGRRTTRRHASKGHEPTKEELYQEAKRRDIPGRSKMDKVELERALHR